jgi:hypothetical protein
METTNLFEKLAQGMQHMYYNQNAFSPAQFNDPIAMQTGWMRASMGGGNFRTFKYVQVNPYRVEFKTTLGAVLFALTFALLGTGVIILVASFADLSSPGLETIVPVLLGFIFACLGGYMLYRQMLPIVFDKREGLFWRKRKPTTAISFNDSTDNCVRLDFIHALQIIAEFVNGKNGGYFSFELNLVLKNGKRINLIDHSKKEMIDRDAQRLADFLKIPLWDATR